MSTSIKFEDGQRLLKLFETDDKDRTVEARYFHHADDGRPMVMITSQDYSPEIDEGDDPDQIEWSYTILEISQVRALGSWLHACADAAQQTIGSPVAQAAGHVS